MIRCDRFCPALPMDVMDAIRLNIESLGEESSIDANAPVGQEHAEETRSSTGRCSTEDRPDTKGAGNQ